MRKFSEESHLINKILNETFENLSCSNIVRNKDQLGEYFLEKEASTKMEIQKMDLKRFCLRNNLACYQLNLNKATFCYELELSGEKISFPKNWSFFTKFNDSRELVCLQLTEGSALWEVFHSTMPPHDNFIFFYRFPNLYLISGKTLSIAFISMLGERLREMV